MSKIFWKSLLVSPAILGASLVVSGANAAETATVAEAIQLQPTTVQIADATQQDSQIINQLENYSNEGQSNSNDQVTNVNELRDVSPTAWAYEALRSLVERYGCIVGYPDRTFRGDRALSRWEFAAGLNACMNTMERLIQENVAVLKEDIEKLKRLMQEFEAELAALGARVDNLEGRVSFLEDHQFSTTTKLAGEVIFAVTDSFGDDDDTQTVFGDRVRLELNTSFTGEDRLVTRLAAGNLSAFETNNLGVVNPETTQTFNLSPGNNNSVQVDWLAYYYPLKLSDTFQINTYIPAFGGIWEDIAPTTNPYFEDYGGGNGALSPFASNSSIYKIGGGAGIAANFQVGFLESILGPTTLTLGYMAGGANSPNEGSGLFNGDYAGLAQLNFNIFDTVNLGFTYINAFHKSGSPIFGYGATGGTGVVGTTLANFSDTEVSSLLNTNADIPDKVTNSYGSQLAWKISDAVNFSAYFSYTSIIAIGDASGDIWSYGGGFSFPDLGKEGSVLGIFAGVQPYLGGLKGFNVTNNNPIQVEAFYKYQLTDNISITPGVIWLTNPQQDSNNTDVVIGTLRTTFSF